MALLQSTRTNGEDGSAEEDEIVVETIEQEKRDFSEADKIDDKMLNAANDFLKRFPALPMLTWDCTTGLLGRGTP